MKTAITVPDKMMPTPDPVEKKTVEFKSPCDGTLCEICVESGDKAGVGDVLGYIEEQL